MSQPIDRAEVEIVPDVDDFDRKVKRELDQTFAVVERKLDDVVDAIEHGFERMVQVLDANFSDLQHSVDHAFDKIQGDARGAARTIAVDIEEGTAIAKHAIDDLADDARHDFNRIERDARGARGGIAGMFSSLFSSIGQGAATAVGSLSQVGGVLGRLGNVGDVVIAILKVTAISALVPVIFGLSGALLQLLGILALIPAAIGFVVAAIAPLLLAFHGITDAVQAGLSGDINKFNEALKGLAPSARKVVKEIVGLKKVFSGLQTSVQEAFFKPLVGAIRTLATQLIPTLSSGLSLVAGSLGRLFAGFIDLLVSNDIIDDINDLFKSTARIIDALAPKLIDFIGVFFGMLEHGLPFLERMFAALGTGIGKFTDFLSNALSSGNFEKWLEDAFTVLKDLWDLLRAVANLIGAMFGDMGEAGQGFIKTLTEMINKLADFFRSNDGKEFLANMKDALKTVGAGVIALGIIIANFARFLNGFITFVKGIGPFFVNLWNTISGAAMSAWNAVTGAISSAWNAIVGAWNSTLAFIQSIPGAIANFFTSLPGTLRTLATQAFDAFFFAIGFGMGKVFQFLLSIPTRTSAIFMDWWNQAKNIVVNGVNAVANFVSTLPTRVAVFVSLTWNRAKALFTEGVNTIVNFAKQLGPRVGSAAASLPGAVFNAIRGFLTTAFNFGQDMINGMINGVRSAAGRLVDAAKRAVLDALRGAASALGAHSPSREWAKLGVQSVQGYAVGFRTEADDIASRIARSIQMPLDAFNRNSTTNITNNTTAMGMGGFHGTVLVQIGDDQLRPATIRILHDAPQDVALAAQAGETALARRS